MGIHGETRKVLVLNLRILGMILCTSLIYETPSNVLFATSYRYEGRWSCAILKYKTVATENAIYLPTGLYSDQVYLPIVHVTAVHSGSVLGIAL